MKKDHNLMIYFCVLKPYKPDVLVKDTYFIELIFIDTIPTIISIIYMIINEKK